MARGGGGRSANTSTRLMVMALPELSSVRIIFLRGDESQAEACVSQLVACGQGALPILEVLLDDPGSDARWWAVRALAEIPGPQSGRLLLKALQDRDPAVRQCAALALRHSPEPDAVPELVRLLGGHDRMLARLAADALIAAGKAAVPALLDVVNNGPQASRLEAIRALASIGEPSSIPTLFAALDEESALMEYWAGEGLEKMGVGMAFFKP